MHILTGVQGQITTDLLNAARRIEDSAPMPSLLKRNDVSSSMYICPLSVWNTCARGGRHKWGLVGWWSSGCMCTKWSAQIQARSNERTQLREKI